MKFIYFTFITSVCLFLSFKIAAQGGIAVNNGKLFFEGVTGEVLNQTLTVSNPTDDAVQLQIFLGDWKRDSLGIKQYSEPGTLGHSCANWLNINPPVAVIPPQGKINLNIQLSVPETYQITSGVQNAMIFLRQMKPFKPKIAGAEEKLESDIQVLFQVGVHVYYTHPALQKKAIAIQDFQKKDNHQILLALQNMGEVELTAYTQLELTNLVDGTEIKLFEKPYQLSFMPDDFRYVSIELPETLPKGKFSALAIVDIGMDYDLEVGILEFENGILQSVLSNNKD